MTLQSPRWLSGGEGTSLTACAMILIAAMSLFTLACLPIAIWAGEAGLLALISATVICITSGLAALVISFYCSAMGYPLPGMLLAMGCRMLPPLVVCLWLALNKPTSLGRVFAGFLITAYLLSLAVETYLSIRVTSQVPRTPQIQKSPRD